VQVVTDATIVCRSIKLLIQSKCNHIFRTPCCVHVVNNALKDISKIQWVSIHLGERCERCANIYLNHHTSLAIYRAHSRKGFLRATYTRYANYYLLLERMLKVQSTLQVMVATLDWNRWTKSKIDKGKKTELQIFDNDWWADCSYLVSFLHPILQVICYIDTNPPSLGEIYETFDNMSGQVKATISEKELSLELYRNQIRSII